MPDFQIGEHDFLLDGEPRRILSGALHYFRVHPDQWADRIHKARLMGLNTIETYVAWNAHARAASEWNTSGGLDLGRFLDLVAAEGMHAIVRPGPYICAEYDNGGLPAWLFRDDTVGVRRLEPQYIAALSQYLDRVYEIVVPRQIDRGGPVVLVQIENEYGAYGADREYLTELVRITRAAGITVPLTTIDQPQPQMLEDGSIPGLHKTGSFGSRAVERMAILRKHQPTGPLVCMEFWNGWFDDWGSHHHTTSAADSAAELDAILRVGGSVNFYMFHGGTNFGLTNGANDKGRYRPIVTSYDYDAPLDEGGNPTEKYFAFRDVIARYAPVPEEVPARAVQAPVVEAVFDERAALFPLVPTLGATTVHAHIPTFDDLAHDRGIGVFAATIAGSGPGILSFGEVRDRAWVYLDGDAVGVLDRESHERAITLPRASGELLVVVEDQGRVNYGARIGEHKGIIGGASLDGVPVVGWTATAIDLDLVPGLSLQGAARAAGPFVARASFELDDNSDLYLDTGTWGKGFAWVNGFNLGRYWRRGPQRTLYVPAPVTRPGRNELVILEFQVIDQAVARFVAQPDLGHTDF